MICLTDVWIYLLFSCIAHFLWWKKKPAEDLKTSIDGYWDRIEKWDDYFCFLASSLDTCIQIICWMLIKYVDFKLPEKGPGFYSLAFGWHCGYCLKSALLTNFRGNYHAPFSVSLGQLCHPNTEFLQVYPHTESSTLNNRARDQLGGLSSFLCPMSATIPISLPCLTLVQLTPLTKPTQSDTRLSILSHPFAYQPDLFEHPM